MSVNSETLTSFVSNRDLVRIERAAIDTRTLQGFPLAFSDDLLAIRYVYDFHLDGLLFLRRDTITDMVVNATARFQRGLLEKAGEITDDLFHLPHSIESFSTLLTALPPNKIVILEEESLGNCEFRMGRYVKRKGGANYIQCFSGAGNWHDDLTNVDLESVTCCQLDTNYIRYYQEHFDSVGFPQHLE